MKPLHIVFNMSAAGSLRQALALMGRDEDVIGFIDSLEYGPVQSSDISARARWVEDNLEWTDWSELADDIEAFWRAALDARRERIVWFCPRSVPDYCNFLEWLSRNGGQPCDIIDLSDVWFEADDGSKRRWLVPPLGVIRSERFVEWQLIERRRPLSPEQSVRGTQLWDRLLRENAPLRVIQAEELVSVSIDYFDNQLMAYASGDWKKVQLIVGTFLGDMFYAGMDNDERPGQVIQTGDILPFSRLRALVEAGRLACQGDFEEGNSYLVRLPE